MKTKDEVDFVPGMTLWEPYRRAGEEWYMGKYARTTENPDFWEGYAGRCYSTYEAAVAGLVDKLEDEIDGHRIRLRRRIYQWLDTLDKGTYFNVTEG
jgi:hypothetical protein